MDHGQFSGQPVTLWDTEQNAPDRNMQLVVDFWFQLGTTRWDAPLNSTVNGASIPQPLWSLVGSPYTGDYRRASIVHDVACEGAGSNHAQRRAADKMFYHACRAGGCSIRESTLLYVGVRIGAWWNEHRPHLVQAQSVKLREDSDSENMRRDYEAVGQDVLARGEVDDAAVVEARTDQAMSERFDRAG
jgi:hypothetical protein